MDEAPEAFAMATVNKPTGPHPSTATERPERSCSLVANTALPNGSWSVAISGGNCSRFVFQITDSGTDT